jgi:hypothetical protein
MAYHGCFTHAVLSDIVLRCACRSLCLQVSDEVLLQCRHPLQARGQVCAVTRLPTVQGM